MIPTNDSHKAPKFPKGRFRLGAVVGTPGAIEFMQKQPDKFLMERLLARHMSGDWGDLCEEDKQANDEALIDGGRILSSYNVTTDQKVWIITEADRSATTFLLPEEY